jgi:hypothetical protein
MPLPTGHFKRFNNNRRIYDKEKIGQQGNRGKDKKGSGDGCEAQKTG